MATSGIRCDIKKNFIPKSKIKEKIESYKAKIKNLKPDELVLEDYYETKIEALQEFMEEK